MAAFSDYIPYVDESGSADLAHVDPDYPLLVLSAILVSKSDYIDHVVPQVQRLKFDFVGHDQLILHEIDIRKQGADFLFLRRDPVLRRSFLDRIGRLVAEAPIEVIAAVIRKDALKGRYADPFDPYEIALQFCLEMAASRLLELGQSAREVCVVFERRGAKEDDALELAFRRIVTGSSRLNTGKVGREKSDLIARMAWMPRFVSKKANSSGLQLADLTARPIGLGIMRPDQSNRALDTIRTKVRAGTLRSFP